MQIVRDLRENSAFHRQAITILGGGLGLLVLILVVMLFFGK